MRFCVICLSRYEQLSTSGNNRKHIWKTKQKEFLPLMVIVYKSRHGTYLYCIGIVGWIFKQTIIRIEELSRHQEKKLPWRSTVVQPLKGNLTLLWSVHCVQRKAFLNLHSLCYILIKILQDFNQNPYPADCLMPRYVKSLRGYSEMEWLGGLEWSALCGLFS